MARLLWRKHAWLALALAAACTGQIGDAGDSSGPNGGSPDASLTPSGDGGSAGTSDGATPIPFFPLTVASSVTKVKTILTGLAATQSEIDAVTADVSAFRGLVDTWMKTTAYQAKMEGFFQDAFQQSQVEWTDFQNIDDGNFPPNDALLANFRESFARTMTGFVAEGRPFTESATTTQYQMTTAMMTYLAHVDTDLKTDDTATAGGEIVNRYFQADPKFSFQIASRPTTWAESGDPASPNYLVFSLPDLKSQYSNDGLGEAGEAECSGIDPVIMTDRNAFDGGNHLGNWIYSFMLGRQFWYFNPPQDQPNW